MPGSKMDASEIVVSRPATNFSRLFDETECLTAGISQVFNDAQL